MFKFWSRLYILNQPGNNQVMDESRNVIHKIMLDLILICIVMNWNVSLRPYNWDSRRTMKIKCWNVDRYRSDLVSPGYLGDIRAPRRTLTDTQRGRCNSLKRVSASLQSCNGFHSNLGFDRQILFLRVISLSLPFCLSLSLPSLSLSLSLSIYLSLSSTLWCFGNHFHILSLFQ